MQKSLRYSLFAMLLAAAGMLAVFLYTGVFPFGPNTVVTGDLGGMYLPFYADTASSLGEGFSFYSLSKSLGGGTAGLSAYIPAALYMLLTPLFPKAALADFFALLLFLKLVAAAGAFALFLSKKTRPSPMAALLGFCYAFMSYAFIYAQNTMWLDNLLLLPLLLLALDFLIGGGSLLPFAGLLTLSVLSNYYTAFMLSLFSALYFFRETLGERGLRPKACLRPFARLVAAGLLGAGLAAVMLFPMAAETIRNKGFAASAGGFLNFSFTDFTRQLVTFGFTWDQVENGPPILYCGVICLSGLLLYFLAGRVSPRRKIVSAGLLLLLLLSLLLAPLNRVWHIFRDPVWFPYRFSFVVSAFLLLLAAEGIDAARGMQRKAMIRWLLSAAAAAGVIAGSQLSILSVKKLLLTAALLAAVSLLLSFILRPPGRRSKRAAAALLAGVVFAEMAGNGGYITAQFPLRERAAFFRYTETVETLLQKTRGEGGIFRTEKDSFVSLNDPLYFSYFGFNHFSSVADAASENILGNLGYAGVYKNPTFATAPANALLSLRYLLSDSGYAGHDLYAEMAGEGEERLYGNPYALPFAFETKGIAAEGEGAFRLTDAVYSAILGYDAALFEEVPLMRNGEDYRAEPARDGMYYLSFFAKTDGSRLIAGGEDRGYADFYSEPGIAPLGVYRQGEAIRFSLNADETALWRLDTAAFQKAAAEITAVSAEARLLPAGGIGVTYTGETGGTLFLSLPFDVSWQAEIDGRPAEILPAFSDFSAVPVTAGAHEIVLRYRPAGFAAGAAVSAVSAVLFLLIFISSRSKPRLWRRERHAMGRSVEEIAGQSPQ